MNRSTDYLSDLLQGDYLYGGPAFDAAMDAAARDIQPRVQGAFNRGGRLNSGLAQTAMASELADAFANLYNAERGRQSLAALQLNPVTETTETPYFGNELASALGIGSSLLGLGQGLFGGGDGGLLNNIGDFFGLGSTAAGGFGDFAGDIFGGGSDGGGVGIGGLPPGSSNVLTGGDLGGFDGFEQLFGGGGGDFFAGITPSALSGASSAIGAALGPELLGLANLSGIGTTGALAGAPSSFGAFASGLPASALESAGAAFPGAFGSGAPAAASGAPAASGGLLSGGLGTVLGAAAPLALAGFGALSVRGEQAAERAIMAPVFDALEKAPEVKVKIGGKKKTGRYVDLPDGKRYFVPQEEGFNIIKEGRGTARTINKLYDPKTRQWGQYDPEVGFQDTRTARQYDKARKRADVESGGWLRAP